MAESPNQGRVGCHSFLRSSPFHGCLPREFTIRRSWTVMATVLPNQGAFTRFIVRELSKRHLLGAATDTGCNNRFGQAG